jgi:hypothetical protein
LSVKMLVRAIVGLGRLGYRPDNSSAGICGGGSGLESIGVSIHN